MSGQAGPPRSPGRSYRIAMVAASPFPYPQGSQVLIGQLASALIRRGHAVQVVAYHDGAGKPPEGVPIHRIRALPGLGPAPVAPSWQKPLLDVFLTRKLLRLVQAWRPDVLHAHNIEGLVAAFAVRRLARVPVAYHVHNAMGLELHTYFRRGPGRWTGERAGRWLDAHLPRRADACIVLNEAAVPYFRERGVRRPALIPPGIDYVPGDGRRAREALGDGPLVVYAGNLDRYQDLDLLFRAFAQVVQARPAARLVLSTNARPNEWQARGRALGIANHLAFLPGADFDGVRDLLAAADVAVCPRMACLGFPIKLLNYMAAGRAIVASAGSACGLRPMEDAWVVPNGDAGGMATAIIALLDNPELACRLGQNARQAARKAYTWERAVEALENVYAPLIEHPETQPAPRKDGRPN